LAFKIRRLRELHQLSQEEMAFELGISQPAYSKIERGKTELGVPRLQKIADILKCSVGDLMERSAGELMKRYIDCSLLAPPKK
jgi:transcriptional regulator with XRE-family HTH domain